MKTRTPLVISFRPLHYAAKPSKTLKGFIWCLVSFGIYNKDAHEFIPGRSLLEISHLSPGWFVDVLFIHVITFSKLFWKKKTK